MTPDLAPGPLFVVSMWRSGSSLLYALLNQHPQVALMYEAELPMLWPVFLKPGKPSWAERWDFWNQALTRHQIDRGKIPANLCDQKAAFETVYKEYARRKGAHFWGDKSPNYYDRMNDLAREFPGSRFIVVWRNPADTCRSMLRAAASGSSYFQKKGMTHRALLGYHKFRVEYGKLLARGVPTYAIDYERLTSDPAGVMRGICDFLGIPFDPKMSSLEGADRSALYGGEHHAFVRGERIVARSERPESLSAHLKCKIARYISLWHGQYDDDWPAFHDSRNGDPGKPGVFEKAFDQLLYRCLRILDSFTVWVYSFAPLEALQKYRAVKAALNSSGQARSGMQRLLASLGLLKDHT